MRLTPLLASVLATASLLAASPASATGPTPQGVRVARLQPTAPPRGVPPPPRARPAPRAARADLVSLDVVPAKKSFVPGEHVPVRVVLMNRNPQRIRVYELRKAFMHFTVVGPGGRIACRAQQDLPRRVRPDRFLTLASGDRLDKSVYLDGLCGELPPGPWRVELDYEIPADFDGDAWRLGALTGRFHAETTLEVEALGPRANVAVHLARPRRTRVDEPLEVEVRIRNFGPDAAYVLRPLASTLDFRVTRGGQPVSCPPPLAAPPRRSDVVFLSAGRDLVETVDLAKRCRLDRAGDYVVDAEYTVGETAARLIPRRGRDKLWTGRVATNALPFSREAAAPRATLALDANPPFGPVPAGAALLVNARLLNLGPDSAVVADPAGWLDVQVWEAGGRSVPCRPRQGPRRPDADMRRVRPGASLVAAVDLTDRCGPLRPGRYDVVLRYAVPGISRVVRVGARRSPLWSGEVRSETVSVTVAGMAPPPAPPPAAAAPSLTLSGSRKVRMGEPIPVTLTLTAPRGGLRVARLAPWMVRLSARDKKGRALRCREPMVPRRMPRRADFVNLREGETVSVTVNLDGVCDTPHKGRWEVEGAIRIPDSWAGRGRREAWTGQVSAEPVRVRVRKRR